MMIGWPDPSAAAANARLLESRNVIGAIRIFGVFVHRTNVVYTGERMRIQNKECEMSFVFRT
jgi:hypothetical protein